MKSGKKLNNIYISTSRRTNMWLCFECGEINDPIPFPLVETEEEKKKYKTLYLSNLIKCDACGARRKSFINPGL